MTTANDRMIGKSRQRERLHAIRLFLLFAFSLAAWTLYFIQADLPLFSDPEVSSMEKWKIWLGLPLLAACLAVLAQWGWNTESDARAETRAKTQQDAQQINAATVAKTAPREYGLEVIGLGVSLDKHRQGKLWEPFSFSKKAYISGSRSSPYSTRRKSLL